MNRVYPALLIPIMLAGSLAGCTAPRRPVSMEILVEYGRWRLEGVKSATIDMGNWRVRIRESAVNDLPDVPRLEKLDLEIKNTSDTLPLYLEPREIILAGVAGRSPMMHPNNTIVLAPGQARNFLYEPGIRAPMLPYPFKVLITVFRGPKFENPQTITLRMY